MSDHMINVGDVVFVMFNNAQCNLCDHNVEVLYVPMASGDSWHFKNLATGDIYYVSEGCTVTKKAKQP